jgi:hypothetical protein
MHKVIEPLTGRNSKALRMRIALGLASPRKSSKLKDKMEEVNLLSGYVFNVSVCKRGAVAKEKTSAMESVLCLCALCACDLLLRSLTISGSAYTRGAPEAFLSIGYADGKVTELSSLAFCGLCAEPCNPA